MRRVLFVAQSLGSGGAERRMVNIAIELKKQNFDPEIICLKEGSFYLSKLEESNIKVIWFTKRNYLVRIITAIKYIRNGNFDIVVSFLETPNIINCLAAIKEKKWKTIIGEASAFYEIHKILGWKYVLRGKIIGLLARYCDIIVCNSNHAAHLWTDKYPRYSKKIRTIYNPVVLPEIGSNYIPKKDGIVHVIVAASYQHLKNPVKMAEALAMIEDKSRIRIDWYGRKAEAYTETNKIIHRHSMEACMVLHDQTKDIANLMMGSDVVALISQVEGLPNAICEGMMMGKPILMSKISDYSTMVDERNGVICDTTDVLLIKKALEDISNLSVGQLKIMGTKSKERALKLFSPDIIFSEWIALLS